MIIARRFTRVPSWVFNDEEFSAFETLVFAALCMFQNSKGLCYPSIDDLIRVCKIGETSVFAALNGLENKGAITRERRFAHGTQATTLYTTSRLHHTKPAQPKKAYTASEIDEWAKKILEEYQKGRC